MNDVNTSNDNKVNKKVRRSALWRWFFASSLSSNYERMQALSYCFAVLPFLKVAYRNKPDELKKSVLNHLQFFNTNPWVAPYILGINVAIEEKADENAEEAVTSIKTGLMGPAAGLGDSLFTVIPWTIFGAMRLTWPLMAVLLEFFYGLRLVLHLK